MPRIDADRMTTRERYHLMTSTIVPRPIAWVTTMSAEGVVNCAPFSFFNGVSADPPLVSIAVSRRRDGRPKDTWRNVAENRELVVHVVDEAHAHVMVETSASLEPEESEVEALQLQTVPSEKVGVPRLADAKVAMECRLEELVEMRGGKVALLLAEILAWHVADSVLGEATPVDVHRLMPVARLGGQLYCPVRDVFEVGRPR